LDWVYVLHLVYNEVGYLLSELHEKCWLAAKKAKELCLRGTEV